MNMNTAVQVNEINKLIKSAKRYNYVSKKCIAIADVFIASSRYLNAKSQKKIQIATAGSRALNSTK